MKNKKCLNELYISEIEKMLKKLKGNEEETRYLKCIYSFVKGLTKK